MIDFITWCEARRQKDAPGQLTLFGDDEPDSPSQEPFPEPAVKPAAIPKPSPKTLPSSSKTLKVVRAGDLMQASKEDPSRVFTIKSFGSIIQVKDLHRHYDNSKIWGRIVGYDNGKRYLVSRSVDDRVLLVV